MLLSARNGHEAENAQQPVARPTAAQDRPVSRNESQTNHTAVHGRHHSSSARP